MDVRVKIYLVSYHSECNRALEGASGQFKTVEEAIAAGEWPYDNGDDPSFYVALRGGPLTWGVCRQDVRNQLSHGDVVVFFCHSSVSHREVLYRLSAVATVASRTNHLAVHTDARFRRHSYINVMVRPKDGGWHYDEDDRPVDQRHADWLWRMADPCGARKDKFEEIHTLAYESESFSKDAISRGTLKLADNYVVFSADKEETFVAPTPVIVATAQKGNREQWCDRSLKQLTVDEAGTHGAREYLRSASPTGYVHRHIRFEMDTNSAKEWRAELIARLRRSSNGQSQPRPLEYRRKRAASCAR